MHKRTEAERAIRTLALDWMRESVYKLQPGYYPSFSAFTTWLEGKHYSHYLNFRSRVAARSEAEVWFESEIRNYWQSRLG